MEWSFELDLHDYLLGIHTSGCGKQNRFAFSLRYNFPVLKLDVHNLTTSGNIMSYQCNDVIENGGWPDGRMTVVRQPQNKNNQKNISSFLLCDRQSFYSFVVRQPQNKNIKKLYRVFLIMWQSFYSFVVRQPQNKNYQKNISCLSYYVTIFL